MKDFRTRQAGGRAPPEHGADRGQPFPTTALLQTLGFLYPEFISLITVGWVCYGHGGCGKGRGGGQRGDAVNGHGQDFWACRAAWEKQKGECLEMYPVGCLGVKLWAK